MVVAAAAMGLSACQNEFDEPNVNKPNDNEGEVVVSFVSEAPTTRTSVDTTGDSPLFSWDDNETFALLEQTDALAVASNVTYEKVDGKAHIAGAFASNVGKGEYNYVAVYPASGYVSAESIESATLALPANQTMAVASYDPTADLMVSRVVACAEQPTEAQQVQFTRVAAVVKMTLKNLALDADDQVEKVVFTAEGKSLAGTITANLNAPHEFAVAEGVSSVTIATTSDDDIYFTVLPTALEAGDKYTVSIFTNKKIFIKSGSIGDKSLTLEAGMVNRFGVNMMGVEGSDKWTLVKDASTLSEGDIVTIVAKDHDMAISKKLYSNASETSTSARRDAVAISKLDEFLIANDDVQPFTLVAGASEGTFSFYDETRAKFLVSTNKTSRYLISQEFVDANTSFAISIVAEDGDATIKNTVGEYAENMIRYYNSSKYFYSGTSAHQAVCVYKLANVKGEIPTVAANVTVPDADEPVVIAEEGATVATAISEVVFNYVGEWSISATSEAEWVNLAYDTANNCLTYTAEANSGAVRETVVTITASLEGQESLTWTFNLLQKGAPMEISIEEFMTKGKDENVTYKITGRITDITTSSSGTYKLTDEKGNIATVTYVFDDAGNKLNENDAISVKVGDVMTVTTVVASNTKGKGGSSAYPTIYKGHYGLSTTLGVAADYTGGSVEIDVATYSNGNIVVPDAVTATMAENDYAEFSYDGGAKATVTFASENTTSDAREAVVTFTYGLIEVEVVAEQGINPANKVGFELVTDASTLAIGDEVIIVAKNADKALACPTSTSATSFPATEIKKTGKVIYDAEDAGVQVFTLGQGVSEGTVSFDFTYKDVGYRLYYSSGLKLRATSYAVNAATSWSIEINAEDGDATITSTRLIKFNSAGGTTFTAYATTNANATKAENAVAIYKKQK